MKSPILLSMIVMAMTVQGCASLNEAECREADWEIIGLEDGSAGMPLSQIGQHRKACAEYGVKPDIGEYQLGHTDGVRLFCSPRKGYELGKAGRGHHEVCPSDLRAAFVAAYDNGRDVHNAQRALRNLQNRIKAAHLDLDDITQETAELEAILVSGGGSVVDRQSWLDQIKRLRADEQQVRYDLLQLEHEASDQKSEYEHLLAQYRY